MGTRAVALGLVLAAMAAAGTGCGDDGSTSASAASKSDAALSKREHAERAGVEQAIRAGKLPPVTIEMFHSNGTVNPNFIPGPDLAQDLVRSSADGTSGPPLKWDLDGDGKISAAERHITEMDLFQAAAPYMARGAQ